MVQSNLKAILDERNIKVLKVAKDIDYRYESVRKMYNNESIQYHRDLLSKLCDYLEVSPGDLLIHEKDPTD